MGLIGGDAPAAGDERDRLVIARRQLADDRLQLWIDHPSQRLGAARRIGEQPAAEPAHDPRHQLRRIRAEAPAAGEREVLGAEHVVADREVRHRTGAARVRVADRLCNEGQPPLVVDDPRPLTRLVHRHRDRREQRVVRERVRGAVRHHRSTLVGAAAHVPSTAKSRHGPGTPLRPELDIGVVVLLRERPPRLAPGPVLAAEAGAGEPDDGAGRDDQPEREHAEAGEPPEGRRGELERAQAGSRRLHRRRV